jgi:hypothetical protein
LFYLGINDLYRLAPAGDYDESVKRVKVYEGWEKLKMRSAVFNVYRNIKGFVSVKNMGVGHRRTRFEKLSYTEKGLLADYRFHQTYIAEQFIPRVMALTAATKRLGSEPIFVTQRSFAWKENDGKILGVANTFNFSGLIVNGVDRYWLERGIAEAVIVHCAAAKLVCIDAFHVNYDPGDFYDLNHNSPAGAAKLGRYLGETLAQKTSLRSD